MSHNEEDLDALFNALPDDLSTADLLRPFVPGLRGPESLSEQVYTANVDTNTAATAPKGFIDLGRLADHDDLVHVEMPDMINTTGSYAVFLPHAEMSFAPALANVRTRPPTYRNVFF